MASQPTSTRPLVAVGFGVLGGVIVALVTLAFLWPVATSQAQDLPVGVVGGEIPQQAGDLPIETTSYDSRDEAVQAIEEREVYGALVFGQNGPEALVSSADGQPAVSVVEGVGTKLASTQGATLTTTDVVPLSEDDPSGAGMGAMGFPLVLGGIVGGVLVSLLVSGVTRRLLALGTYAVLGGLVVAVVTGPLLGILGGHFWMEVLAIGTAMLATASTVVGLHSLMGPPGIGLGTVVTMLIGNPISGTTQPYQFISGSWGEVGQYFVPGAAASLVREVNYFPDASSMHEWLVLVGWIAVGVLLSVVGHHKGGRPSADEAPQASVVEESRPAGAHLAR